MVRFNDWENSAEGLNERPQQRILRYPFKMGEKNFIGIQSALLFFM